MRMGMAMQLGRSILGSLIAAGSTLLNDLVSYWPLNETSGTRYDVVGGNDLTDTNTVGSVKRGPIGTVARFNSDNLTVANPTHQPTPTWSIWFNNEINDSYQFLVTHKGALQRGIEIWTFPTSAGFVSINAIAFNAVGGTQTITATVPIAISQWQHCFVWFDDSDSKLYIESEGIGYASPALAGGLTTPDGNLMFGDRSDLTYSFHGSMSNVGWWGRVLTAGERISIFNSGNGKKYADLTTAEKVGLVSYWNMDEASGTRVDSHGSNDLTDNNTVGSVAAVSGAIDGASAKFVAANNESLSLAAFTPPSSDMTVSGWVYGQPGYLVALFYAAKSPYLFTSDMSFVVYGWVAPGSITVGAGDADLGLYSYAVGTGVLDASWNWVCAWYDSADKNVHITINNGSVVDGSTVMASGRFNANGSLQIGGGAPNTFNPYDGLLDEVAIWSRVLTSDERTELYNAGVGKFYPFE